MIHEKPIDWPVVPDDIIRAKCRTAQTNHRRRARADGASLNYDAEDLFRLAQAQQICEYCLNPLGWDWQFDHRLPLSRSPRGHRLDNLAVVCGDCNRMKGKLSDHEYVGLMMFLRDIDPRGAADVRHRLKAGGAVHVRGRKR